jgi:two-component system, NtrC family, nitrogen regulation response regulator NtrX
MSKVLVVDDEDMYCEQLLLILQREGHEVRTASGGQDGIRLGLDFRPAVLVADWMLAGEFSGLRVARELQQADPELRAIVMTGFSAREAMREAQDVRVSRYLEKPFGVEEIVSAVREALAVPPRT